MNNNFIKYNQIDIDSKPNKKEVHENNDINLPSNVSDNLSKSMEHFTPFEI